MERGNRVITHGVYGLVWRPQCGHFYRGLRTARALGNHSDALAPVIFVAFAYMHLARREESPMGEIAAKYAERIKEEPRSAPR